MPSKVVLIHGWSASSPSMQGIAAFLQSNGYAVTDVWMSDYLSLADDVRVADVGRRMNDVLEGLAAELGEFDVIVHSTGGLVVREWLSRYYPDGRRSVLGPCPVRRLVMLAPANFGSRLAAAGKSFVGRIVKGWGTWFQTGTQMLNNLELGSDYQWRLAQRDLISPGGGVGPYGPGGVLPFVIIGSRGHTDGLEQIADEIGSDGVVRPCAASLNAVGMSLTFVDDTSPPAIVSWASLNRGLAIPLAVLPNRNHSTVTEPAVNFGTFIPQVGDLILQALACAPDGSDYSSIDLQWRDVSDRTHRLTFPANEADPDNPPAVGSLDRYLQVIVHVMDDQGEDVRDYFVEFYDPDRPGDEQDSVILHTQVIRDTHIYSQNPSYRCFFVNMSSLLSAYYQTAGYNSVAMSLSAARIGDNVAYFNSKTATSEGHVVISTRGGCEASTDDEKDSLGEWLREDRTHLIEIVIPREPTPDVFRMAAPPYQAAPPPAP